MDSKILCQRFIFSAEKWKPTKKPRQWESSRREKFSVDVAVDVVVVLCLFILARAVVFVVIVIDAAVLGQ